MRAIAKPRPADAPFLDWSGHKLGPLAPCRLCRRKAFLRDELARPCHKVCAELELSKTLTKGAAA